MSVVKFLLFGIIGTVLSWATWVIVLWRIDPVSGGLVAQLMFFLSLWLALVGTGTIIGFLARYALERQTIPYRQMAVSARQALNLSVAIVLLLVLQASRQLSLWTGLLTLMIAAGIEAFFLTGQARQRADTPYEHHPTH